MVSTMMSLSAGKESASASTEHRLEGCSYMRMFNERVHSDIGKLLWCRDVLK